MSALYARYGPKAARGRMDLIAPGTILDCGDLLAGRYLFWVESEEIICLTHAQERERGKFTRSTSCTVLAKSDSVSSPPKLFSFLGQELAQVTLFKISPSGQCSLRARSLLDGSAWYARYRPGGGGSDAIGLYRTRT
jgi:hypothetical protein